MPRCHCAPQVLTWCGAVVATRCSQGNPLLELDPAFLADTEIPAMPGCLRMIVHPSYVGVAQQFWPRLFIGPVGAALNRTFLLRAGVTHIVNLAHGDSPQRMRDRMAAYQLDYDRMARAHQSRADVGAGGDPDAGLGSRGADTGAGAGAGAGAGVSASAGADAGDTGGYEVMTVVPYKPFARYIAYHHVKVVDTADVNLTPHFCSCIAFMRGALQPRTNGSTSGTVLVHCEKVSTPASAARLRAPGVILSSWHAAQRECLTVNTHVTLVMQGVSRSGAVCIAYLMAEQCFHLEAALGVMQAVRPIVRPNSGFMRQLRDFEARVGLLKLQ